MIKRLFAFALAVMLILSISVAALACNEQQTETYILQVLFGYNATTKGSDENAKILLKALYVCCEQCDNQGQDKIEFLKQKGVPGVSSLNDLNIKGDILIECSHNRWEYVCPLATNNQNNRRKVLQNAVNKIFDFGLINNWFGSGGGKCNSFAALLYYTHILSDYLADNPDETNLYYDGNSVSSFSGQPYTTLNGNRPSFSNEEKQNMTSSITYSSMDSMGRAGVAMGNIGPEIISGVGERQNMVGIKPSGLGLNLCHLNKVLKPWILLTVVIERAHPY